MSVAFVAFLHYFINFFCPPDLTDAILDDDLLYADEEGTSSGAIYKKTPDKGSFLQTMR